MQELFFPISTPAHFDVSPQQSYSTGIIGKVEQAIDTLGSRLQSIRDRLSGMPSPETSIGRGLIFRNEIQRSFLAQAGQIVRSNSSATLGLNIGGEIHTQIQLPIVTNWTLNREPKNRTLGLVPTSLEGEELLLGKSGNDDLQTLRISASPNTVNLSIHDLAGENRHSPVTKVEIPLQGVIDETQLDEFVDALAIHGKHINIVELRDTLLQHLVKEGKSLSREVSKLTAPDKTGKILNTHATTPHITEKKIDEVVPRRSQERRNDSRSGVNTHTTQLPAGAMRIAVNGSGDVIANPKNMPFRMETEEPKVHKSLWSRIFK